MYWASWVNLPARHQYGPARQWWLRWCRWQRGSLHFRSVGYTVVCSVERDECRSAENESWDQEQGVH